MTTKRIFCGVVFVFVLSTLYSLLSTSSFGQSSTLPMTSDISVSESEKISLDLKGMEITELFKLLSIKTNKNIVPTKNVSGRVTLYLNNVTFEDVFDVILVSNNLAYDRRGDIITVMTAQEYEALYGEKYDEKRKVKIFKLTYAKPSNVFNALGQIKSNIGKVVADEASGTIIAVDTPEKLTLLEETLKELDQPLSTELFELKYAKAKDVETHISKVATSGASSVMMDERTNKIMVSDLPDKVSQMKRMVKNFDASTKQVLIEARIIQINLSKKFHAGIDWEYVFNNSSKINSKFPLSSTPAAYGQLKIGTVGEDDFAGILQVLNSVGKTNMLSRPRIMVLNNQEAKILIGTKKAYVTSTLSQGQSTTVTSESIQYVDVGLKLNVTPTINNDGFVMMKIKPEVSSAPTEIKTALGSVIPIVETSEADTAVKVKDGVTVIIAGLMKDERRREKDSLPGVSKIPVLGNLFKNNREETIKSELVVFLTPHIVEGDEDLLKTPPSVEVRLPSLDIEKDAEVSSESELEVKTPADKTDLRKKLKNEQSLDESGDEISAITPVPPKPAEKPEAIKSDTTKKHALTRQEKKKKQEEQALLRQKEKEDKKQAALKKKEEAKAAKELKAKEKLKAQEEAKKQKELLKQQKEQEKAAKKQQEALKKAEQQRKQQELLEQIKKDDEALQGGMKELEK